MVWIESISSSRVPAQLRLLEDSLELRVAQQPETGGVEAQPAGAQHGLLHRLLAARIEDSAARRQLRGDLQQQRRLADAGLPAQQRHGACGQPAAEYPIELAHPEADHFARRGIGGQGRHHDRRGASGWGPTVTRDSEFHSAQCGHWPCHFKASPPQL